MAFFHIFHSRPTYRCLLFVEKSINDQARPRYLVLYVNGSDYKSSSLCKTHDLLDVLLRGVEEGKCESLTKRKSDELWILKEKNVEKKTLELKALLTVVTDATNSIVLQSFDSRQGNDILRTALVALIARWP